MCITFHRPAILSVQSRSIREPGSQVGLGPKPILGVVIFTTHRGELAEAILDGEGRWSCPRLPVLDRVLNILFEPGKEAGGGIPFGHAELDRVAAWIKGRVRLGFADAGESS